MREAIVLDESALLNLFIRASSSAASGGTNMVEP